MVNTNKKANMTLIRTLPKLICHRAFRGRHCENPAAKDKTVRPKVITWWFGEKHSIGYQWHKNIVTFIFCL